MMASTKDMRKTEVHISFCSYLLSLLSWSRVLCLSLCLPYPTLCVPRVFCCKAIFIGSTEYYSPSFVDTLPGISSHLFLSFYSAYCSFCVLYLFLFPDFPPPITLPQPVLSLNLYTLPSPLWFPKPSYINCAHFPPLSFPLIPTPAPDFVCAFLLSVFWSGNWLIEMCMMNATHQKFIQL